jgi:WD40 repeat protein
MGGNSSYSKEMGIVPIWERTHTETGYKIDGHKVLVLSSDVQHVKNILNSNSSDATYLIATRNGQGELQVKTIDVFRGHSLYCEINIVVDKNGDMIPSGTKNGTHCHYWNVNADDGILKRKAHDKRNTFPVTEEYSTLLEHINNFNKQKKV